MSTTIDSLVIDIQSSSDNAVGGIERLAEALNKMKKSTISSTAIKNLKGLTTALKELTPVSSNANKLGAMARSLSDLAKVGSLNGVINQMLKLPEAMRGLSGINLDGIDDKFERIALAAGKLSNVKAGGLSSMVNALAKIGSVTASLDDKTIDNFAERVEKLTEKLEPLSKQMTTVKVGLDGINSAAKKAGGGIKDLDKKANSISLSSFIFQLQQMHQALTWVIQAMSKILGDAIEWDGIEYQFGNAFGEQADEYYKKITEITDALKINKQMFMENSAMATSMLIGFGVDSKDARKMGVGYTELAYDIWAAYNNVYKTLDGADGAMAAIRSAIAGEVEPIRRAGFTIVESTLEQTAANHGLSVSIEKASESQKSYLRYLTLVDQAKQKGIIGTYASEMDTAEGLVRGLTQGLKSLSQAFGSLFLPILVRVIPYVQAFVEVLTDAVYWLANLFGIDIQPVDFSDYNKGMSNLESSASGAKNELNSATKAAKELKNATLGIDELNIISPQTNSGSGSGSGGGGGFDGADVDSIWDQAMLDSIKDKVAELKDQVKDALLDLMPILGGVATALGGLKLTQFLDDLDLAETRWGKLSKGITVAGIALVVGKLVWDFTGAYLEDGNWASFLGALGTTAIGTGLAYKFAGKGGLGFTLMVSGVAMLSRLVFDLSEGTVDFGDPQTWITMATGGIETLFGGIITWKVIGPTITKAVKGLFTSQALASLGTTIGSSLSSGWAAITAALASVPVWGWIAAAIVALIGGAVSLAVTDYDFTEIGEKVGYAIGWAFKNLTPAGWAISIGQWLVDAVKGAIEWFKQFQSFDELAAAIIDGLTAWMRDVKKWYDGFVDWAINVSAGIKEGFKKGWDNLIGNLGEFFTGLWDGLCKAFGIASPAKKMEPIGDYIVQGIWGGITGAFNWIVGKVTGWATDLISKITGAMKPSAISEKLSTMWTNAKNWWNNSKAALASYTPSIGSIKDKLSSAWSSAKTWWDKTKAKLATYTPSIGSIKDKLSSAWTTAKTWWSKSKGALSYTPTIGSIKDKLVSAWNTAKSWWTKNVKLSIPSLSFKVAYSKPSGTIQKAVVKALGLDGWPKLSFAANGGLFDAGSLIWAGESGPEVLANAGGGKTGVMNVQQMSEAVYEGVYSAVVAAMRASNGGGGAQAVNVYLDGKQIYGSMEQHRKERGASLMGNQVYAH